MSFEHYFYWPRVLHRIRLTPYRLNSPVYVTQRLSTRYGRYTLWEPGNGGGGSDANGGGCAANPYERIPTKEHKYFLTEEVGLSTFPTRRSSEWKKKQKEDGFTAKQNKTKHRALLFRCDD